MDKLELLKEANRRGILPPEQKALYDEAVKRGLIKEDEPGMLEKFAAGLARGLGIVGGGRLGFATERATGQPVGDMAVGLTGLREDRDSLAGKAGEFTTAGLIGGAPTGLKAAAANVGRSMLAAGGSEVGKEVGGPVGEIAGAVVPDLLLGGAGALARRGIRGNQANFAQNVAESRAVGAQPSVGTASGRVAVQKLESALESIPGGDAPLRRAGEVTRKAIERRLAGMVDDVPRGPSMAGAALQDGVDSWVARQKLKGNALFRGLERRIGANTQVATDSTRRALDDLAAKVDPDLQGLFSAVRNEKTQRIASEFAEAVTNARGGQIPFSTLKQLRSEVGGLLASPGLIADIPKGNLKYLYGALSDDLRKAAEQAGPDAVRELSRANKYWKSLIDRTDRYLDPINRTASPDRVYTLVQSAAKNDLSKLRALRKSLTPSQWDVVKKTFLGRLGRLDDAGESLVDFNVERFFNNYAKLPSRSRDVMFGHGEFRQNLEKLVRVAKRQSESAAVLRNPSGTANRGIAATILFAGLGSLAGGPTAGLGTIAGATAGANVTARLLTNPRFVSWLAKGSELPASRISEHLARLDTVVRDPEDAEAIDQYLKNIGVQ